MKLFVITYVFPPYLAPRSIQIGRLVRHLRLPVHLYCAEDPEHDDLTLKPPSSDSLKVTRVKRSSWEPFLNKLTFVLYRDIVFLPDRFKRW